MRDEGWRYVTRELRATAECVGGLIGVATLVDCKTYRSSAEFQIDRERHLNEAEWFESPVMYGFVFADMEVRPYRRLPGWMRFFPVQPAVK
jgi:hypothetical protein